MPDEGQVFPDQSHMDRVRDALWGTNGNGASVMVGSGFSRCAVKVRPDADEIPMLPEVASEMAKRLYPNSGEAEQPGKRLETTAPDGVLSLAQEYETAFGRGDLHQFLEAMIRDSDFKPGNAHSRLLRLPWKDVFTTNWDTLLERTRPQVTDRAYSVVRDMEEIPLANRPRIVKLHGSLPAQFPLILTEEAYRTYPTTFAPFVNTVQQAMMETVFCLIGFSGNDPNFLNWSGWVRDNLGVSSPKIYLAGWLDLPQHRRRMLEGRGVVPIDLARHPRAHQWPEHQRHGYAIEWMLHTLEGGRPYDLTYWPSPRSKPYSAVPAPLQPVVEISSKQPREEPARESEIARDELQGKVKRILETWRHNRKVYPGWLFLPAGEERETFSRNTDDWEHHLLTALPGLTAVKRLDAIRELVWRREILLEPITDALESAAADALEAVDCQNRTVNGDTETGIDWSTVREAWRTVALALVTAVRFRFDSDLFRKRTEALEPFLNDDHDVHQRLCQERCLWAIYSMDFETLEGLLEDWQVSDCDPIWMVRKAALFWESNRNGEAAELVRRALEAIRSSPDADDSVASASREGWALSSAFTVDNRREFRQRWDQLAALKCDAMLETDLIARKVNESEGSQEAPAFDLGVRRGQSVRFSAAMPGLSARRAIRLSEVAGLPPATKHEDSIGTAVASGMLKSAAEELATVAPELAIRLILRVCGYDRDKALERVLSRTRVALLPADTAKSFAQVCAGVINYALPRVVSMDASRDSDFWTERTRVAMEVLSRLVVRLPPDMAGETLDIALQCYRSHQVSQHLWLMGPLGRLLQRSWEALPGESRSHRALDLLAAPIAGLDGFSTAIPDQFPDPGGFLQAEDLPTRTPENDGQWHEVITQLVRGLDGDDEPRKRAAQRMFLVAKKRLLTEAESSAVAQALWSEKHTAPNSLPAATPLFDWVFLALPEPLPGEAERRFRLKWLSGDTSRLRANIASDGGTITVPLGGDPVKPDRIEDVLWTVGTAISGLRDHGRPLHLADDERQYLVELVEHWAHGEDISLPPAHPFFQDYSREPTRWALRGLETILAEGLIPEPVGEHVYEKVKSLTDSGTPGLKLMLGLVMTLPDRSDELLAWLRTGLASEDNTLAANAVLGLHLWLTTAAQAEPPSPSPPDDLLREVGLIISSRRRAALSPALQLAKWVFDEGTPAHRDTMSDLVLQGLSYLAEELKYENERQEQEDDDLPRLRWRCAELVQSLAQSGFREEPVVAIWLELAQGDPLPEVRYAVTPSAVPGT